MTVFDGLISIAQWVFVNSLKASVLIGLILAIQWIARDRLPAKWHHALWLILIFRLLLPSGLESNFSLYNLFGQSNTVRTTSTRLITQPIWMEATLPDPDVAPSPRRQFSMLDVLAALWFCGVLTLTGFAMIGNHQCWNKIRNRELITDPALLDLFAECLIKMQVNDHRQSPPWRDTSIACRPGGTRSVTRFRIDNHCQWFGRLINRPVQLAVMGSIQIPMLYGWLNPVILLPDSQVQRWSPEQIRHILCHELAHLKRHDILIAHITTVLQILHWFNPLMWMAFYKIRLDREVACDAIALNHLGRDQSKSYGATILSLLENISTENLLPMTVGIVESKKNLRRRLISIAKFKKPRMVWTVLGLVLALLIGCGALTEAKKKREVTNHPSFYDEMISVYKKRNPAFEIYPTKNLYGFKDSLGNVVILPKFDFVNPFYGELAAAKKNGYWGLIDTKGSWIVEPQFKFMDYQGNTAIRVCKDDYLYGLIDRTGEVILPFEYKQIRTIKNGLAPVLADGKWGYVNSEGQIVFDFQFDQAFEFSNGRAGVIRENKLGFIDETGKLVIPYTYNVGQPNALAGFSEGLTAVEIKGKYGFINTEGELVIKPRFETAGFFSEGLAAVQLHGKSGFINHDGKFVIPPKYGPLVGPFTYGQTVVHLEETGQYYTINKEGKIVYPPNLSGRYPYEISEEENELLKKAGQYKKQYLAEAMGNTNFYSDHMKFTEFNEQFYYDLPGRFEIKDWKLKSDTTKTLTIRGKNAVVLKTKLGDWLFSAEEIEVDTVSFQSRTSTSQRPPHISGSRSISFHKATQLEFPGRTNRIIFKSNGKEGYKNREGEVVIEARFEKAGHFVGRGKFASVKLDGKWGYIDTSGTWLIEPAFDEAQDFFQNDMAIVKLDGKSGYVNTNGELVIPPRFEIAYPFTEGFANVRKNEKSGFIDLKGDLVIDYQFDRANIFLNGLAAVEKNGKWGFIDTNGEVVIPCQYEQAEAFSEGLAAVRKNGKFGYINPDNAFVIPLLYEEADHFSEGLAAVKMRNNKYGFIDKTGETVIAPDYDMVMFPFENGSAGVLIFEDPEKGIEGQSLRIDRDGKVIPEKNAFNFELKKNSQKNDSTSDSEIEFKYRHRKRIKESAQKPQFSVIIDAGHGGKDPGAKADGAQEKDLTLKIVNQLAETLEGLGFIALMTRNDDSFLSLQDRIDKVNNSDANIALTVHVNYHNNEQLNGITFYHIKDEEKNQRLCETLMDAFQQYQWMEVNPLSNANFLILQKAEIPIAHIETGYMSNPKDLQTLTDPDFLNDYCNRIAEALQAYIENQV